MTDPASHESKLLTGEIPRDSRYLHLLVASAKELFATIEPPERMRRAVDRAIELTGSSRGILFTESSKGLAPRIARHAEGRDLSLDLPYTSRAVNSAWSTGELYLFIAEPHDHPVDLSVSMLKLRLYAVMAIRLDYEGHRLGVLYLDAKQPRSTGPVFSEQEERVLHVIAGLIGAALENAWLEEERAHKRRIQHALSVAGDIQAGLLPQRIDPPAGYDMAGMWEPSLDLSGDYYDVIRRRDGRLAIAIGDVSGHGIRSALYMMTARALVRKLMQEDAAPDDALAALNEFMSADMVDCCFMSLFLGIIDPDARTLTYGSAGHNPPLLYGKGRPLESLGATGPALAIMPGPDCGLAGPIRLSSGDVLLLYTDGIYEVFRDDRTMWGEKGLADSFTRHVDAGLSAKGLLSAIREDLDAFRGSGELHDDLTGLAVKVL